MTYQLKCPTEVSFNLTHPQLYRIYSFLHFFSDLKMTLTVDGCALDPFHDLLITAADSAFSYANQVEVIDRGYYVLLNPLSKGNHVIHFTANQSGAGLKSVLLKSSGFTLDVTYKLTVA